MLAGINRNFLLYLIITVPLVVVGAILYFVIKHTRCAVKTGEYKTVKMMSLSLVMILTAAASFILNMGWLRFIMLFLMLPFVHAIIYFVTNLFAVKYIKVSKKIKISNIIFNITYIMFYLLLPDADDVRSYVFFRLIHNDAIVSVCSSLSSIAFITQTVTFIMQIVEIKKLERENRLKINIK